MLFLVFFSILLYIFLFFCCWKEGRGITNKIKAIRLFVLFRQSRFLCYEFIPIFISIFISSQKSSDTFDRRGRFAYLYNTHSSHVQKSSNELIQWLTLLFSGLGPYMSLHIICFLLTTIFESHLLYYCTEPGLDIVFRKSQLEKEREPQRELNPSSGRRLWHCRRLHLLPFPCFIFALLFPDPDRVDMRASLTMFCPPKLRGAGRSRRTFEWSSGETLARLRRRDSVLGL